MTEQLADKLQRLCCAETESAFFSCLTDNIEIIIAALREPATAKVRAQVIQTCANIASRHRPNLTARDIEQEIRALNPPSAGERK